MGLEKANSISIPAKYESLPKDKDGEVCNEDLTILL